MPQNHTKWTHCYQLPSVGAKNVHQLYLKHDLLSLIYKKKGIAHSCFNYSLIVLIYRIKTTRVEILDTVMDKKKNHLMSK